MKRKAKIKNLGARVRLSWPETGIVMAYEIAKARSEDPYLQVGGFARKMDGSIILGYNGAPSNIDIDWTDRDERRKRVLHAETNVLNFCRPNEVTFMAVTHLPCPECLKAIAQKGIPTVYYSEIPVNYDYTLSFQLAKEFGVKLEYLPLDKIIRPK